MVSIPDLGGLEARRRQGGRLDFFFHRDSAFRAGRGSSVSSEVCYRFFLCLTYSSFSEEGDRLT